MHPSGIHYFPITFPFLVVLAALVLLLLVMVLLDVLHYVYIRMGIAPRYVVAVLLLSLAGSYLNIPIMQFPGERIINEREIIFFGMHYVVPMVRDWPGTVLAVNVGGAVIPVLTSVYLLVKNRLYSRGALATAIVASVCYKLAYPMPGLGIAIPVFIPPIITAIVALTLSRRFAAPLAYIGGSLGTLIGADILNLGQVQGLGASVVSIGGAGTFDGIFVTGLMAVLFASIVTHRSKFTARQPPP